MFIQTEVALLYATPGYIAALTAYGTQVIHLYSTPVTITPQSVVTDFTEATFTGYASVDISTWAAVYWQSQGAAVQYGASVAVFQPASPFTITQTVYGYYITASGTPAILIGAESFTSPIPMANAGDQISIVPVLGLADAGIPGQVF